MSGKKLLLVEGKDDEHIIKNICGRLSLGKIDTIKSSSGIDNLLDILPVELKSASSGTVERLGIILDADLNAGARWNCVRKILLENKYENIPKNISKKGTILATPKMQPSLPRLGIWIMPDNSDPGAIEDFLKFLIPNEDKLFPYAENVIAKLPIRHFRDTYTSKALLYTWLAWQKEPGKPYGQAITAKYLDTSLPAANIFVSWLREVFFE